VTQFVLLAVAAAIDVCLAAVWVALSFIQWKLIQAIARVDGEPPPPFNWRLLVSASPKRYRAWVARQELRCDSKTS
jgi:hypothetical protein